MKERVQEIQQNSEERSLKQNFKFIWIIVPLILFILGFLIFFSMPDSLDNLNYLDTPINILDKSFILDSNGIPASVRVVAELDEGFCKLVYGDFLTQNDEKVFESKVVTFIEYAEKKFNLDLWGICCDSSDFEIKTKSTICVN